MATLNLKILAAAHREGLLDGKARLWAHPSVNTANRILKAIRSCPGGADLEQLEKRCQLSGNTLLQYTRALENLGAIEVTQLETKGTPNLYLLSDKLK